MLTQSDLKSLLHYDPETGEFTRLAVAGTYAPCSARWAGIRVGKVNSQGYARFSVLGQDYQAHRVAWLYMTGEWPLNLIDHINGKRADNRWVNLRVGDPSINRQNQREARADNGTGFLGVGRSGKRYCASLCVAGQKHWLGSFATAEAAHAAYLAGKRRLHPGGTI